MSFLEQYDAISKTSASREDAAHKQLAMVQQWVVERPNEMFAELRAQRPVFVTPGPVIVSRYRDVIEVADVHQTFNVKPYAAGMIRNNGGPNFLLGMENTPEYDHERAVMKLAIRREDLGLVRSIIAKAAASLVEQNKSAGHMDLTDGYARRVPTMFAAEYLGVPGPSLDTLATWVRLIFTDIFLNFTQDPMISQAGAEAGKQFRAYIDGLVAQIKADRAAGAEEKDDVIGRLVSQQKVPGAALSDSRIRDNLIGMITGILENTNTAVCNVINWLLDHPEQLAGAQDAARADDDNRMLQYVLEVMRFHTAAGIMVRMASTDYVLGKGTEYETKVPAHSVIFAANGSAMMDEREVDQPEEFRLGRPAHHYLHWGWGLHECFGKYISHIQVPEICKAVLKLGNLRRAPGEDGKLKYQGPFPKSFAVEFDATAGAGA